MIKPMRKKPICKGYVSLILHTHLPYIRHDDRDDYMEERWFYEAMLETYLPLLAAMERLEREQVDFRLTFSMTPTLLSLCSDELMQQRFLSHMDRLIQLADLEIKRLGNDRDFAPLAWMYAEQFRQMKALFMECGGDIVSRYKALQDSGKIEIMTSAATHAFLPLVKTEEAIRAQIVTAVRDYERHFGRTPRGIWLPECGFTPGVDRVLKEFGIAYFIADTSAIRQATPRPNRGIYAPLMTPYGVTAIPRDPESSAQVWSSQEGYPGDYSYREYYRDIGWDLGWDSAEEWAYIRPYVLPTHERVNTGIKYYRITGPGNRKEAYRPDLARQKAAEHASHFLWCRQQQAERAYRELDRIPWMVSPYDAELFGHWWYEGPIWIEMLCRKIHFDQNVIRMVTPSEYLNQYPLSDTAKIHESSWGRNASAEVWLQKNNDWIYRHLHQGEDRMIRLATRYRHLSEDAVQRSLLKRALNQAARELMLAQSSDWAFIMDSNTVVDYAVTRTKQHLFYFNRLCGMIENDTLEPAFIQNLEQRDNCFPAVDFSDYASLQAFSPVSILTAKQWSDVLEETKDRRNLVMLAWEYPPKNVGGLSKAVCELSEALAEKGEAVHVITTSYFGTPYFEKNNGVYIHRVPVLCSGQTEYFHWMFEMNLAMTDHLVQWKEAGGRIDVLHAHDWMVYYTARELKLSYRLPLIATIHATEWGRNQGTLYNELQHKIHAIEWNLTNEAEQVTVCSRYMADEVKRIFHLPPEKVSTIPNGIRRLDADPLELPEDRGRDRDREQGEKIVFFIGRLVFEKGVQILLQAAPQILAQAPGTKFIIGGSGPMEEELRRLAAHLGDKVEFVGFIDKERKKELYDQADVCVIPSLYEPFGIVALEAMQHLRPLVVSDTGGLAEIIEHGMEGFKALPGHADSLAWHICQLLANPGLGRQMAEAAYLKLSDTYKWDVLADEFIRLYDNVLEGGKGRSANTDTQPTELERSGDSGSDYGWLQGDDPEIENEREIE